MDAVECLVIGAGVVGLAVARAGAGSPRGRRRRGGRRRRDRGELAQQRSHPRWDLLPARPCQDSAVRRRQGDALPLLPRVRRAAPAQRQADRRRRRERDRQLAVLEAQAKANGVDDLLCLSGAEARTLEPALRANRALLSPSTGIVDSHALMLALKGDAEAHGAMIALATPVVSGRAHGDGVTIETGGAEPMRFTATLVVNAAGLDAQAVARAIDGLPADKIPPLFLAKGNYFSLTVRSPFSRLVYPMPEPGGLGVYLTLDLAGQARFGPDVEWVETIDYNVDPRRAESFYAGIRTYWPDLPDGALQPGYAGIRPKIARPGGSATDFLIQTERDHGVRGLVNLFGIESPGLTASLAIAEEISKRF
jgi:L-2-hydroxyglutarate oxidase LhgO